MDVAGKMLDKKIHRVPVTDSDEVPIGIVTRSDIMQPCLQTKEDLSQDQSTRR